MSIRARLFVSFVALSAVGMLLLWGLLNASVRASFVRAARTELSGRAVAAGESVADALEDGDTSRTRLLVDRYGHQAHVKVQVLAPDGQVIATSQDGASAGEPWANAPGAREALLRPDVVATGLLSAARPPALYEARVMRRGGRTLGVFWMSLQLQHVEEPLQGVVRDIGAALLLIGVLGAVASAAISRTVGGPIQEIRNFAVRLGTGVYGEKLQIGRRDELGELARELNRVSERLASDDHRRRTFLANVSHELRTPITNVQVTLEALQDGACDEPELSARFIRTCLDETTRLARLIELLLDLGRYEADAAPLEIGKVDLRGLVRQCERMVEGRLLQRGLQLQVRVPDVRLRGDRDRLLRVFANLLDNAINYAAPDSVITVYGDTDAHHLFMQVRDQGPGISELDLPHVFEEFYTADRSRMRRGSGLGLPIARRIVEAHGGTISAESTTGKGSTFTVCLPLTAQDIPSPRNPGHFTKTLAQP